MDEAARRREELKLKIKQATQDALKLSRSQMPATAETSTDATSVQDKSQPRATSAATTPLNSSAKVVPKCKPSGASVDSCAVTQPSYHKTAPRNPSSKPEPTPSTALPRTLGPLAAAAAMLSGAERLVLVLVGALSEDVGDGAPPLTSAPAGASSANGTSSVRSSTGRASPHNGTTRSSSKLKSWRGRGVSDEALLVALHDAHALGLWSTSSAHSAYSSPSSQSSPYFSSSSSSSSSGFASDSTRSSSHRNSGINAATAPPAGTQLPLGRGVAVVPNALLEAHSSLQAQGLLDYHNGTSSGGTGTPEHESNLKNDDKTEDEREVNDRLGSNDTARKSHVAGPGFSRVIDTFTSALVSAFQISSSNGREKASNATSGSDYCFFDDESSCSKSHLDSNNSGGRSLLTSQGGELLMALALRGPWVAETLSSLMLGLSPAEMSPNITAHNGSSSSGSSKYCTNGAFVKASGYGSGKGCGGGVFLAGLPPRALLGSLCLYFDATSRCYVVCASSRGVLSLDPTALRRRRKLMPLESAAAVVTGSSLSLSDNRGSAAGAAAEPTSTTATADSSDGDAGDGSEGTKSSLASRVKASDKAAILAAAPTGAAAEGALESAWAVWDESSPAAAGIRCRPARVCGASLPLPLPKRCESHSTSTSRMPTAKAPPMNSTKSSYGSVRSSTRSNGDVGDGSEKLGIISVELEAVVLHYQLCSSGNGNNCSSQLTTWAHEHARFPAQDGLPALAFSTAPSTAPTAPATPSIHRSNVTEGEEAPSAGGPLGFDWSSSVRHGLGLGGATATVSTTDNASKMAWQVESALDGAIVGAATVLHNPEFTSRANASSSSAINEGARPVEAAVASAAKTSAAIAAIACRSGPVLWPLLDAAGKRTLKTDTANFNHIIGGLPVFGSGDNDDGAKALAPLLRWRPSFTIARMVGRVKNVNSSGDDRESNSTNHISTALPVVVGSSTMLSSPSSSAPKTWWTALTQDSHLNAALDAWRFEASSIGYAGLKLGSAGKSNGSGTSGGGIGNHNSNDYSRGGNTIGNMAAEKATTTIGRDLIAVNIPGGGAFLLGSSGCLVLHPPPSSLSNPAGISSSANQDHGYGNGTPPSPLPRFIIRLLVAYGGHTSRTALLQTLAHNARATADRASRTVTAANERASLPSGARNMSSRQGLKENRYTHNSSVVLHFTEGGAPPCAPPPPLHLQNSSSLPLAVPPPWVAGLTAAGGVFVVFAVFRWCAGVFTGDESATSEAGTFSALASFCFHALRLMTVTGAAFVAASSAHTSRAAASSFASSAKPQLKPPPEIVGRPPRLLSGAPFATASSVLACAASLRDALDQLTPVNKVSGDGLGGKGVEGSANNGSKDDDASDEDEEYWPLSATEAASKASTPSSSSSSSATQVPTPSIGLGISGTPVGGSSTNTSNSASSSRSSSSRTRQTRRRWAAAEATLKALVAKEACNEELATQAAERAVNASERWAAAAAAALNASQKERPPQGSHPDFNHSSSDSHGSIPGQVGASIGTLLGTLLLRWPEAAAAWCSATLQLAFAGRLFGPNLRSAGGRRRNGSSISAFMAGKKVSAPRAEYLPGKKGPSGSAAASGGGGAASGGSVMGGVGGSLARDLWDLVVEVGVPFAQVEAKKLFARVKPRSRLDACAWIAVAVAVAVAAVGSGLVFIRLTWRVVRVLLWWW